MSSKKIIAALAALAMTAAFTGCGEKTESSSEQESAPVSSEEATEEPTEEATEAPTEPPTPCPPADCDDPNAITFDDGDIGFAAVKDSDADSAHGELQIAEIQGNPMLAFVDSGTNRADGTVQKIMIDAKKLLAPEDLPKVRVIEADVYATATSDDFVNNDKENVFAPGWIGGGGGANVAGDKWYEFGEWDGGEYNFDTSGPIHIEMKFLLADAGQCWDSSQDEAIFQVMRWGAKNEGDFLIDNIVFKDEDGNSLPIVKEGTSGEPEAIEDSPMAGMARDAVPEGEEAAE